MAAGNPGPRLIRQALHYNWHRHYDPSIGRYTQPDPLGFVDGPSVYAYAMSNPHAFVDPTGLWTWIFGGGATVAGGVVGGTYNGVILIDAAVLGSAIVLQQDPPDCLDHEVA